MQIKLNKKLLNIVIIGLILRLLVLFFVYYFQSNLTTEFMVRDVLHDDLKYTLGAQFYAEGATSLFDIDAFNIAMLKVNHIASASNENFWFWFISIVYYMFRSELMLRLINISFSVVSIILIYYLIFEIYNKKKALLGAKLLAFLPYPVIFCCFVFKDQFVMMLFIYCLLILLHFYKNKSINKLNWVLFIITILIIKNTRSGLDVMLEIFFISIFILKNYSTYNRSVFWKITGFIIVLFIIFNFSFFMNSVIYKLQIYLNNRETDNSIIMKLLSIDKVYDIYKLPFTYAFSILQPLTWNISIDSWATIVSYLNITMIPIASANFLYLFQKKKYKIFEYGLLIFYFSTIIMSLGIFRHFYCLLPIPILFFTNIFDKSKKLVLQLSGLVFTILFMYFYILG